MSTRIRKSLPICFALALTGLVSVDLSAQVCGPGTTVNSGATFISQFSGPAPSATPPGALCNFIAGATCQFVASIMGVPFGPNAPSTCVAKVGTGGTGFFNARVAIYGTGSAVTNPANGCQFNLPGGACSVRGGSGLPVELMEFGVD